MSGDAKINPASVAAVVVTHEPDIDALVLTLLETSRQVSRTVVVDNGSQSQVELVRRLGPLPGVSLIRLEENRGIAAALNLGIRRLASEGHGHTWVLTLDQDTLLHPGAINRLLGSLDLLDASTRAECGVVGLRHKPVEIPRGPWRWAERHCRVRDFENGLRERRLLITSGNLVRREVAETIPYEEPLFMDQVDYAFCAAVRSGGWRVLEFTDVLMDHQIGKSFEVRKRVRRYETGQRLYYIMRNSTLLMLRRQLPASVYVAQLLSWAWAYVVVNGALACPREMLILLAGLGDGILRRLGQRQYWFLAEPGKRRGEPRG
ncbi:MAG: glycosyltransferase [Acidimicrobiales bacterium]|jgi:rhamnosyltransferase